MRYHTAITAGLGLLAMGAPSLHAQEPAPGPTQAKWGAHMVASSGKEWKIAAKVLLALAKNDRLLGTKFQLVETPRPVEPKPELRALLARIRKARRLIFKLKPRQAIRRLERIIAEIKNLIMARGSTPGLLRRLMQANSYLGAAQLLDGNATLAKSAFSVTLNIDPTRELSSKYFSAAVIQGYARLKQQIQRTAELRVNTDKPAFVLVDGHLKALAPAVIKGLTPGEHIVEIRRMGKVPIVRLLPVDARLGADLKASIVQDTDQNTVSLVRQLKAVERELRHNRQAGPMLNAFVKKLKVKRLVLCRASLDDSEASLYDAAENKFIKRVRRLSALPGTPQTRAIAQAMKKASPVIDLQAGTGSGGSGGCQDNEDCPDGSCVSGRCVSEIPIYRKWWFWTIIGVAAAAVAGGTAALVTMPSRPTIRISVGVR